MMGFKNVYATVKGIFGSACTWYSQEGLIAEKYDQNMIKIRQVWANLRCIFVSISMHCVVWKPFPQWRVMAIQNNREHEPTENFVQNDPDLNLSLALTYLFMHIYYVYKQSSK